LILKKIQAKATELIFKTQGERPDLQAAKTDDNSQSQQELAQYTDNKMTAITGPALSHKDERI